ncbi:MAG: YfhO family protein [Chitinophagales bacterium]
MNKEQLLKSAIPHLSAFGVLLLVAVIYFSPLLSGKILVQSDIVQWKGSAKEVDDFRDKTGEEALWTNSMFGGMPAYQISMQPKGNFINKIRNTMLKVIPKPANIILFCMVAFYILMIVMGVHPILAAAGAIAYGLSTYNMLILEAGHIIKAMSIAYMPLVIAGVLLAFRGRYLIGAALGGVGFAFNIVAAHYQITFYMMLILLVFGIVYLIEAVKNKTLADFAKASVIIGLVFVVATATDYVRMATTYEYSKETMRGGSELTKKGASDGLEADYAFAWSYGKMETMTLLIPRFAGGASGEKISKDSKTYKTLRSLGSRSEVGPMYWGDSPFTGGPFYLGAIICFLFVLGCVVVKGPLKWWLVIATVLSIVLSWGKNLEAFNMLFFDFFPMYNKFRVVSMALVMVQLTVPMLGIFALHKVLTEKMEKGELVKALKISTGIVGGLLVFFILLGGSLFDFSATGDSGYPENLVRALEADRASMLRMDAIRSLVFILLSVGAIYLFAVQKIKWTWAAAAIGVLILTDLWTVDKRYLDTSDFVNERKEDAYFTATEADKQILQDPDIHYRVFNMTRSPFNDGVTSYHHKSIGGYHGAKLARYQDLIDEHLTQGNVKVMSMLNTKYVIQKGENGQPTPQLNPQALGNAWFVSNIQMVNNADEESAALTDFNPATTAIVDKRFEDYLTGFNASADTLASIQLTEYQPNYLKYSSNSSAPNLAVFSEVYYNDHKGWNAYIDGEKTPHIRVNYILRALKVPAGQHTIEFKFEPNSFYSGSMISFAASTVILLLVIAAAVQWFREKAVIED